jgi:hypothetical protein
MAEDKIALSIEIEADRAQMSLGELEEGFDGLREKLKATNRGTEEGRKEFKKLSTQMAQTTKEIKNIELGFEGLDREQVASELGSVSGAIGDVTASLILMGGESETMEQLGASIQTAMGISMGIKGVMEGAASANKLYTNSVRAKAVGEKIAAKGTLILNAASKALNSTLLKNPIALVVIAIGLLVAAIWYFSDTIISVIKVALKPFQFAIDAVVDALQWLGIMESDTAIATRKAEKEKAEAALESAKQRVKANEELIKSHKKLTASMVADMDFEIRKRKANGEDTGKLEKEKIQFLIDSAKKEKELQEQRIIDLDNEFKARLRNGKVRTGTAFKLLKAKTEATKGIIKANEELIKSEQDLEVITIEAQKTIDDAAKKSSADRKAQREKDAEDARLKLIDDAKALAEFEEEQSRIKIQLIQDEGERKRAEIEYNSQLEIEALEKKGTLTFDAEMLIAQKKHQALAEITKAEEEKKEAVRLAQIELEKNLALKQLEAEKLLRDTKLQNDANEEEIRRLAVEDEFQNKLATLEEQGLLTTELEIELMYAREQALADIQDEFREQERQGRLELNQERLESTT